MTLSDRMQKFDAAMQPIRNAIDTAVRAGLQPDEIQEDAERHLRWWEDELHFLEAEGRRHEPKHPDAVGNRERSEPSKAVPADPPLKERQPPR